MPVHRDGGVPRDELRFRWAWAARRLWASRVQAGGSQGPSRQRSRLRCAQERRLLAVPGSAVQRAAPGRAFLGPAAAICCARRGLW